MFAFSTSYSSSSVSLCFPLLKEVQNSNPFTQIRKKRCTQLEDRNTLTQTSLLGAPRVRPLTPHCDTVSAQPPSFHFLCTALASQRTGRRKTMFLKVQFHWNVVVPAEGLDEEGSRLQRSILSCLLDDFATKRATEDHGNFMAVTTVESIGEGKIRQHTGDVVFPVAFSGITFKLLKGEILLGTVQKVLKNGLLLRCGPIENIFLCEQKMPDYEYVPWENPVFLYKNLSAKIEKDSVVRIIVIGTKWLEAEREFRALVGMDADYLGLVS